MIDFETGRIHTMKKKQALLNEELRLMQVDVKNIKKHYQQAMNHSNWLIDELSTLFPATHCKSKFDFEFQSGVLVDDQSIYADRWNDAGLEYGKSVIHYKDEASFLEDLETYDRSTFLYIDWYLTANITSFDLIKHLGQDLGSRKFHNIIVTTAGTGLDQSQIPWVKAIIDKEPPWNLGTLNPPTRTY
jgi:hypothetical protein